MLFATKIWGKVDLGTAVLDADDGKGVLIDVSADGVAAPVSFRGLTRDQVGALLFSRDKYALIDEQAWWRDTIWQPPSDIQAPTNADVLAFEHSGECTSVEAGGSAHASSYPDTRVTFSSPGGSWDVALPGYATVRGLRIDEYGGVWALGSFFREMHIGEAIWTAPDPTEDNPDRVHDGFLLHFGAGGHLTLARHFAVGGQFGASGFATRGGRAYFAASVIGTLPGVFSNENATWLLGVDESGAVVNAERVAGPTFASMNQVVAADGAIDLVISYGKTCEFVRMSAGE